MSWFSPLASTCQEMARLLSDAMDHRLPWHARIRMHVHLGMCQVCKSYQRQLVLLRHLLRRTPHSEAEPTVQPQLSAEAKERIRRALDSSHS
jgi:predicted anti-sigma-YlaC factor YlaD